MHPWVFFKKKKIIYFWLESRSKTVLGDLEGNPSNRVLLRAHASARHLEEAFSIPKKGFFFY